MIRALFILFCFALLAARALFGQTPPNAVQWNYRVAELTNVVFTVQRSTNLTTWDDWVCVTVPDPSAPTRAYAFYRVGAGYDAPPAPAPETALMLPPKFAVGSKVGKLAALPQKKMLRTAL